MATTTTEVEPDGHRMARGRASATPGSWVDRTLAALDAPTRGRRFLRTKQRGFTSALVIGDADGELRERLAPRCDTLTTVALPAEAPEGPYDLIVVADVLAALDAGAL